MLEIKEMQEKVKSLRVLIVDDEDKIRQGTAVFMGKFFDDVVCADNGEAALKMFKEDGPYDVILTDMEMPKMRGDRLAQEIKTIDLNPFIAIMTGSPKEDIQSIKNCDMYLPKPIGIEEMLKMMDIIIKKFSL